VSAALGEIVAELAVDPRGCRIYVEGWQSWTPTTSYGLGAEQLAPTRAEIWTSSYGGSRPRPPRGSLQGDGLLIVDPGTGDDIVVVGALAADREVPLIRCEERGQKELVLSADGPISVTRSAAGLGLEAAKATFAEAFAAASGAAPIRPAPTIWCSWYDYYRAVSEADIDENLEAIADRGLPVDVIQLDDGYQREVGDWLTVSAQFKSLPGVVERIREHGHRAGIWIAPFLVGTRSSVATEHPDWLVRSESGAPVATGGDSYPLDVTHPGARKYLASVFSRFVELGIDYFKLDFLYAGALDGRRYDTSLTASQAYRRGLAEVRSVIGPDPYLLGCGAPLLLSVGMVDAMRIGADTGVQWDAPGGDMSQPAGESAELSVLARAYQHGRYWVNDPDCLLLGPNVEDRPRRAAMIRQYGGLRGLSGRIESLDTWALTTARDLLATVPPPSPFQRPQPPQ
jgi:alpha-galactosidase